MGEERRTEHRIYEISSRVLYFPPSRTVTVTLLKQGTHLLKQKNKPSWKQKQTDQQFSGTAYPFVLFLKAFVNVHEPLWPVRFIARSSVGR